MSAEPAPDSEQSVSFWRARAESLRGSLETVNAKAAESDGSRLAATERAKEAWDAMQQGVESQSASEKETHELRLANAVLTRDVEQLCETMGLKNIPAAIGNWRVQAGPEVEEMVKYLVRPSGSSPAAHQLMRPAPR